MNYKKQKGFSLVDALLAVGVLGTVMYLSIQSDVFINSEKKAKIYADQTKGYVNDYMQELAVKLDSKINESELRALSVSGLTSTNDSYQDYSWSAYYYAELIKSYKKGNKNPMMLVPLKVNDAISITRQKPCLLLYYDNTLNKGEFGGIVYYTDDGDMKHTKQDFILSANKYDANFFSYFKDANKSPSKTNIFSPSGWYPSQKVIDFMKTNQCGNGGGVLSNNSLMVNLQTISGFNSRLFSIDSVQRTSDQKVGVFITATGAFDPTKLPNGLANNNTLKSALNSTSDIILKKDSINGNVLLKRIENSGTGYNDTTLQIGSSNNTDSNTAFLTNAIQPNKVIAAGTACGYNDVGKIAVASRVDINSSQSVGRNLVVCTQNEGLCAAQGNYCYLPIRQNEFVFNNSNGVEDASTKKFICPSYAPYLKTFSGQNSSEAQINIFLNTNVSVSGDTYSNSATVSAVAYGAGATFNPNRGRDNRENCASTFNLNSNNYSSAFYLLPKGYDISSLVYLNNSNILIVQCVNYDINHVAMPNHILKSINFSTTTDGSSFSIKELAGSYEIISTTNSEKIETPIGVKVRTGSPDCNNACSTLNTTLGGGWGNTASAFDPSLSNVQLTITGVDPTSKCVCSKREGYFLTGLAEIKFPSLSNIPPITSVTCSTMPQYGF